MSIFHLSIFVCIFCLIKPSQNQLMKSKLLLCPSVCNPTACKIGILTCNYPGLDFIPKYLPSSTNKVMIYNQNFHRNGVLSPDNFTHYQPPFQSINKITIQNCSIHSLLPNTFSKLDNLETLDLSKNNIREILPKTFEYLKLNLLRLDENINLKLNNLSFINLKVKSLHLVGCGLTDLPYDIIQPVESSLEKLFLSSNHLKIIEKQYESLFKRLKIVSLVNNPFDCTQCRLKWLVAHQKTVVYRSKPDDESVYPKCSYPIRFANIQLHKLSLSTDFHCPIASVDSINVVILPNNSASLTCKAGHKSSLVTWKTSLKILSQSLYVNTHTVQQTNKIDNYLCIVSVHGSENSSTTRLQISWPNISAISFVNKESSNRPPSISTKTKDGESYFFQPQFSLIEMIAGVVGTFIGTLILFILMLKCLFFRVRLFNSTNSSPLSKHSQFHDVNQQVNFLPSYNTTTNMLPNKSHCYDSSLKQDILDDSKKLLFSQNPSSQFQNQTVASQMLAKRYFPYEQPPTYSDSQTYDVPTFNSNSSHTMPSQNAQLINQSDLLLPNSHGHFIDFKTQKSVFNNDK